MSHFVTYFVTSPPLTMLVCLCVVRGEGPERGRVGDLNCHSGQHGPANLAIILECVVQSVLRELGL